MKSLCIALLVCLLASTADAQTAQITDLDPSDGEYFEVNPGRTTLIIYHSANMTFSNWEVGSSALFSYRLTLTSSTGHVQDDSGWINFHVPQFASLEIDYYDFIKVPIGIWFLKCEIAEGYGGGLPSTPLLDSETNRYILLAEQEDE